MKTILRTAIAAVGLMTIASGALAQSWTPPGPIKLMIGFRAGGGADSQARLIAEELEKRLGWSFIPEQVTGKGGMNLAAALKDQPNDGTAIGMVVTETLAYNMIVADAGISQDDFTPITTTAGFQMGVVSLTSKGWGDFNDVIAAARSGEDIRFGVMSPKLEDLAYLLGEANDVEFNIVSVRGGRAVMDGVNAGDLDLGFMAGIQARGVAAGDLVNLASALSTPLVQTPEAPLMSDLGVEYVADGYFVFVGPAGMPDDARDALAEAIASVVNDPDTDAGAMINNAFGGPTVIKGSDLDALLSDDWESAGGLLAAASG